MNRVLIIAIGLILALIIGATTQSRVKESKQNIYQDREKCSDKVEPKQGECSIERVPESKRADMFLRSIKRKQRMMYA